jgi:hypothetical protein
VDDRIRPALRPGQSSPPSQTHWHHRRLAVA